MCSVSSKYMLNLLFSDFKVSLKSGKEKVIYTHWLGIRNESGTRLSEKWSKKLVDRKI